NQQPEQELVALWNVVEFSMSLKTPSGSQKFTPYLPQIENAALQFSILEKKSIKTLLKEKFGPGAKINTTAGMLELVLSSNDEVNIRDVTKSAVDCLQALTKQLLANEIGIQGDDFLPLICSDVLPTINKKKVNIYTEPGKLIVVGFRPEVDNAYRELKHLLRSQSQKPSQMKTSFENCNPEFFVRLKIITALSTIYPSVDICLKADGLMFNGTESEVEDCMGEFHKHETNIQFSEEKFSKCIIDLLLRPETKTYIYDVFDGKHLNSYYEVDASLDTVKCFAMSKPKADEALQCISNSFSEIKYDVEKPLDFLVLRCDKWEEIVSKHKDKKLLEQEEKKYLVIFGTKDVTTELHELAVSLAKSQLQQQLQPVQQVSVYKYNPPPLQKDTIEIPFPDSVAYLLNANAQWTKNVNEMVKKIIGAEIRTKENKTILHIEGTKEDVHESVKKAKVLFQDLQVMKSEDVTEACHCFFNRNEFHMYLTNILKQKKLFVFIHTTSDIDSFKVHVTGTDYFSVCNAWKTIKATIKSENYSVGITKSLQEKLSQVEKDFRGKALLGGNEVGADSLEILSTDDVYEELFQKVVQITEAVEEREQSLYETTLHVRKEKVEFLTPVFQQIADKYKVPVRSIQHRPDQSTIVITGTKESNKQISEELAKEFSLVNISCVLLEGNDADYFIRTNEDNTIAKENNCNMEIAGRQATAASCYVEKDKNVLVEIVCARTTDMEVDVIVCPTNDCLFSIGGMDDVLKDDEDLMKAAQSYCHAMKKKFGIGFMLFVDANPTYMTHTVALCVFSESDAKQDPFQSIKSAITKILEKCSSSGLQRIAIPIQIFEDQPVEAQAQAIYTSVKSAITNKTSVNEIYLCVLDPCILDICCSVAVTSFHPNYVNHDWRIFNVSSNINRELTEGISSAVSVSVVQGVLVDQQVDLLVNTVGKRLDLTQGYVSKSILRKAGQTIQNECNKRYPEGISVGQVIMTTSGNLTTCRNICHGVLPGWMPRANFSLKDEKKKQALQFQEELTKAFSLHKLHEHIMYDKVFFINATDVADLEIDRLKDTLVDVAFQQSTWGQQMPIVWVPLDLQISDMREDGVKLITKKQLLEINQSNKENALSERRTEDFLLVQHSIGKLLYFDEPALRDYIIIQPSAMVNILRAFITDIMFWPENGPIRDILENLSYTGVLKKTDLFDLWSQPAFKDILTDDRTKEYVVQVLLHLDILIEPKRYTEKDRAADSFLVPCIVKSKITRKMQKNATDDRTICIAYHLKEIVVPSALSFKLIGAAISIWPLKKVDSQFCLYFQAAILDADNKNELQIRVKGQKIIVYLINEVAKQNISPDLATTTQECLTLALGRILKFYSRCFGKESYQDMSDLFEIEVGEICTGDTCLIPLSEAKKLKHWRCNNGNKHETKYPLNWVVDKNKDHCDQNCQGLGKETKTLLLKPIDQHFVHLTKKLEIGDFYNFFIHLGMSKADYDKLNFRYFSNPMDMMLMGMFQWRDKTESDQSPATFGKLLEALKAIDRQHYLCQIHREDHSLVEKAQNRLQVVPSDEDINALTERDLIGDCVVHLGIELGLTIVNIKKTMFKFPRDLDGQIHDLLMKWKETDRVKPTIYWLMVALKRVEAADGLAFLKKTYGVE
ncbi:Hypothetical predicted protein, partial [Mytilus galloprovincialis]